ncbi:ribosomal-protein-alanine acetyltransferase [Clostridium sp. CAG:508]|jgi:ribosomal-protein-alanine acetyltransferase|nr:ribosomal protein S18-alanine N-acetyltransferase [Clostridia bacterium]CDC31458.1 ribosomal-protein-alanine acetyltransferase [Clostridium sp. CAG:508]
MISEMNLQDLENIKDCLLTDFDNFWSYNILKQELENGKSKYFVAKQENEIVGFAGILLIIDQVNIMNIVVKKDKRNFGIGSSLLEEIIRYSKIHNATSITLEVNEKNIPAIKLYKKYGFKQVGLRRKYYNNEDNAILMDLVF